MVDELKNISKLKAEAELFEDISFDVTISAVDKRFNETKEFIRSGGAFGSLQFKKSTSNSNKDLVQVVQQNALRSRTRLNLASSSFNRKLTGMKTNTSFKEITL